MSAVIKAANVVYIPKCYVPRCLLGCQCATATINPDACPDPLCELQHPAPQPNPEH